MKRRAILGAAAASAVAGLAAPPRARAQGTGGYPDRPIRVIIPAPPGGATDIWMRLLADPMAVVLGQPLVIEARAGGGGVIGAQAALQAPADGYTLFFAVDGFVTAPITQRINPYDPARDFAPIGSLGFTGQNFAVGAAVPADIRTLADYVAWARRQPAVPLGNWSAGGSGHAFAALLEREAKLPNVQHVAYRGEAPMMQDNLAGVFHGGFMSMVTTGEMVRAGRLRPLATSGAARIPSLADRVPTLIELGYSDRFSYRGFVGMFGQARVPAAIIAKLADAFQRAATSAAVQERLRAMDTISAPEGPEVFAGTVRRVQRDWTRLADELDLYQSAG